MPGSVRPRPRELRDLRFTSVRRSMFLNPLHTLFLTHRRRYQADRDPDLPLPLRPAAGRPHEGRGVVALRYPVAQPESGLQHLGALPGTWDGDAPCLRRVDGGAGLYWDTVRG